MRLLLAFALSLAVAGCNVGPNTRVNTYTPFGQFQPGENDRVSQEYTASLASPAPDYEVTILNSSFPPGVTIVNDQLVVAPDAPYEPIARFQLGFRLDNTGPTQTELPPYLRRLAKAAKANMLVISIHQRTDVPSKVDYVEGIALRSKIAGAAQPAKPDAASAPGQKL
ncbi:MAG: hypothetical protein ABI461_03575 [Polyangiaceae bacterium]